MCIRDSPYYVGGVIRAQDALTLQTPESFRARFNIDVRAVSYTHLYLSFLCLLACPQDKMSIQLFLFYHDNSAFFKPEIR